mmetsp:Transcript_3578/g.9570  ORF Transcript_3578/g.9570 Transcript_3578/m.9570 type:complete len:109 (+) Transcript_3578:822-1148(+)
MRLQPFLLLAKSLLLAPRRSRRKAQLFPAVISETPSFGGDPAWGGLKPTCESVVREEEPGRRRRAGPFRDRRFDGRRVRCRGGRARGEDDEGSVKEAKRQGVTDASLL